MKTQTHIQFILDDEVVTVDFEKSGISPTITVLNYLRSQSNHKGVKEGCAEGDCGACTVVTAELNTEKQLSYKAVNSCLVFLPQIHGKQLITVENLADKQNGEVELHPAQQAMVDLNGSQCGYCTPGFIMSMFALYKSVNYPTREIIEDALTGNLCRCTGYEPIIKAAQQACSNKKDDKFSRNESVILSKLKNIENESLPVELNTISQNYIQPKSINELFKLWNHYPDAKIINGSTDIALEQTKKFKHLESLIDLSAITDLNVFEENSKGFNIGAGLNLEEIKNSLKNNLPPLFDLLSVFASKQIRELATLGGNIGSASPIGDTIPLLMALNTELHLISGLGKRQISIAEFITGYRKTALKKQEIIQFVFIPKPNNYIVKFYKISKRKDLDISTLSGGFRIKIENDVISEVCLAYGGMAETPKRAIKTEAYLTGESWNLEVINVAQKILIDEFTPISDARSGAEFRKLAAKNLLLKFYNDTSNE